MRALAYSILVAYILFFIALAIWDAVQPVAKLNTTGHIIHPQPNPHQVTTPSEWRPYRYSGDAERLPLGRAWEAKRGVDY